MMGRSLIRRMQAKSASQERPTQARPSQAYKRAAKFGGLGEGLVPCFGQFVAVSVACGKLRSDNGIRYFN